MHLDLLLISMSIKEFLIFQASFFIAYVVTSWTSLSSELTRTMALICNLIGKHCSCKSDEDDEFQIPSISYHSEIPRILLFGLLGLTYFILAPLILPFILVFFCIGYIIYRNQVSRIFYFLLPLFPIIHFPPPSFCFMF